MRTVCPSCSTEIDTPYMMLGASVTCSACKSLVIPRVESGTLFPNTGFEITFRDFVQLLTYEAYRTQVLSVVKEWEPTVEHLTDIDAEIGAGTAQEKALIVIHRKIQGDSVKQNKLYQTAMSLWR